MRRDNPESQALASAGIPYLSLPQALARFFLEGRVPIVVAGTHGKTTLTALIASCLARAGKDPGFMVGGVMREGGRNFADGAGGHFVVEGDEYDTAFFAKVPKFVYYRPMIGVLTSVEFDHADIYPNLDAVRAAFDMFVAELPPDGKLIAWGDSDEVMARAAGAKCPVETYGQGARCLWRLTGLKPAEQGGAVLSVAAPGGRELEVVSPLAGRHNALNALAGLAALCAAGLGEHEAAGLMTGFGGVRRRQEIRGVAGGVTVVDDFAHHPTAVRETVAALADFGLPGWRPGSGRLAAVFEPRSNTSRRSLFQADYAGAFDRADMVYLREPADLAGIADGQGFSSARLAADLNARGIKARAFVDTDSLLAALVQDLCAGDLALIMSNGGFDNLHERLLAALARQS